MTPARPGETNPMTDTAIPSSEAIKPPAGGAGEVDPARAALRELVALSTEAAVRESEIEQAHAAELQQTFGKLVIVALL